MKLLILFIFLLPIVVSAQSITDYENAMAKFQKFYNAAKGDSIIAMFGHRPVDMKAARDLWSNEWTEESLKKYGKLKSFEFIGIDTTDPDKVYVFRTTFSKAGTKNTSLSLFDDLFVGTFRFITTIENKNALQRKPESTR